MARNIFTKHPSETYPIGVEYATAAPTGAVLASGVWAAEDTTDSIDATGVVLDNPTAVIDGTIAKVRVENGTLDHTYQLGLTATFDTGDVLHDNVTMFVLEDA